MNKDYKIEAFTNDDKRARKYAFIINGKDEKEALLNAQNHITNSYKDSDFYEIEMTLIGNSLTQ
ncbi:hypothetical protein DCS32_13990 [Dokdonia sp. Dokd-P16]|uniref:hypothetical protein n=1 Tax=Dokdonia sp. Dokd-P16 TaxID=2173169 RepID=UPI000D54A845|nr:hypothetical protein [Dokdonia sp. Dokd-P16]AWH75233.1 hypothetical protein DCS32_13990 [Dokdonia sp. Dokd-P16]